jgi:hypothetical protein
MLHDSLKRRLRVNRHQSVLGNQSDVTYREARLQHFPVCRRASKAKSHVVFVNHLSREETKESEYVQYDSYSSLTIHPWGTLEIVGSIIQNDWDSKISSHPKYDEKIEVPSMIGVTIVNVTVLDDVIMEEDGERFANQTGPLLRNFGVESLITGRARLLVTRSLTVDKMQTYVRKEHIHHWWKVINCETLSTILINNFGVRWKESDGSIVEALRKLKFSLCYADRSLEKETADAYFNLIEIYERTYGPLTAQLESKVADMIEEHLPRDSQLCKDFKKKKNESIRQGAAETVQLCFDRLKVCMENARTIIRQGQLYGSPDRVICHHHQSGDSSFWSEYPRPDIKIIEPLKPVTPDQADVPTEFVACYNFLKPALSENEEQERQREDEETDDGNNESLGNKLDKRGEKGQENHKQCMQRIKNKKERDKERKRRERIEEEERSRSNAPVEYICDTCGNTGHKRHECPYSGHRDVNGSNLRWADSPVGQMWRSYGFGSYCHLINLPENDYTEQLRDDQDDADRCRKKRKRGQSPMRGGQ